MDELAKLQLVSKVCGRLDEELGVGDRTLAEFVIHLAEAQGTPSAFGAALAENGADFPEPFVAALFATFWLPQFIVEVLGLTVPAWVLLHQEVFVSTACGLALATLVSFYR